MEIFDDDIMLRTDIGIEYAADLMKIMNERNLNLYIASRSFPINYSKEDAIAFIRRNREVFGQRFAIDFFIFIGNELAGVVTLDDIDYENKSAHIGYILGKKYRNHGYMTRSVSIVIDYGNKTLKLHRIYTSVIEFNKRSLSVLLNNGFYIEGISRDSFLYNGRFYSMIRVARIFNY
ncbi:GNAT family N-acetyltransferase [Picrophilus oshimae]|uniref:Acetyltransferase n=1 Tax=Picrophilus torridus (strain ATCC 700027 / DSM 9790 / JCM 10055 / NBRC 100828 / KAW 2/3) TaxID=1122961 RepID=Q6KZD7_PICTO|nr:GNAT family protein [Picrophilus oshimae]AAT43915.1 acetyltransferase [Picrophilus oshimae DSM 9789]SMD31014.1 hypothetical protein SAMN02745355_0932 [Picrophilus oshimae DSM 9789]